MFYLDAIKAFEPGCEQEESDKRLILEYIESYPENVLLRENEIAHLTGSSIIFNADMTRVLMAHHHIYRTWAWTGGHADGETDLLKLALREAHEETGITTVRPLSQEIVSLDILPVPGHFKHGKYVSAHLHLSVAYAFMADEGELIRPKPDENSGVMWIEIDRLKTYCNEPDMVEVYQKIIDRAKKISRRNSGRQTNVRFYNSVEDAKLKFVVIVARCGGKWVLCKHKDRDTYEVPGGHREPGEDLLTAAARELYEETGALDYELNPVCVYSVTDQGEETFGLLCYAEIKELGLLPEFEIERVELHEKLPGNWTYPLIQPLLIEKILKSGLLS